MGTADAGVYNTVAKPSTFSAYWNNVLVTGSLVTNDTTLGYDKYTFTVLGTGTDTLAFDFTNDQGYFDLDNISLASAAVTVPEPATLAMFGMGLLGLAGAYRGRRLGSKA